MGGGSYSVNRAATRSDTLNYKDKSTDQIFTKKSLDSAMNPDGVKVRESRDSDEHPESKAIMLGLDVTGSMGSIPKHFIAEGMTTMMGTILQRGVTDPQLMFFGIGDHEVDRAPLQVSQFESSDELLDKWLKEIWLESGGGGNAGESYLLAWYFAAYHTAIDCFEKRGQKGLLITIGDEPTLKSVPSSALKDIMGDEAHAQGNLGVQTLLDEARKKYEVYHIHLTQTPSGSMKETQNGWKEAMGDYAIMLDDYQDIPKTVAKIAIDHFDSDSKNSKPSPDNQVDEGNTNTKEEDEVIL